MWLKVLIAVALFLVALAGVGIYSAYRLESRLAREDQEKLRKLEPRVIAGAGRFAKTTFYTGADLGKVTQILAGWPADREGAALTVVGTQGVRFLDGSGALKKQVHFPDNVRCPMEVARLDANGDYGFLTRDQSWAVGVTLLDKRGQKLWSYDGLPGIDDSASGDVLGEGKSQVVIGFNGRGGLFLMNSDGKKIWQKTEANVWHVETLDIKGDGRREILHSNAQGQLLVRDAGGDVIARYLPDHYASHFALTRWGPESQATHILIPSKERGDDCCKPVLLVLDAQGKAVADFQAPLGDLMNRAAGTPVRYENGAQYYAALQNADVLERSIILLYDKDGQIAYQEIIRDSCRAIAVLPGELGDQLLVGCSDKIWQYSPAVDNAKSRTSNKGAKN